MSKIGMTNDQIKAVYEAFMGQAGHENSVRATLDKAIKLGLVRPASDEHAAHFKELWESIEGRIKAHDDLAAKVAALEALVGNSHPHEIDFPTRLATLEAWRHSMMQDKACPPDPHAAGYPKAVGSLKCAIEHTPVGTNLVLDPHAAAKERATLWGVELVTLKDGTCLFMTEKHYLSNPKPSWFPHVFSFRSPHYSGGHKTPSEAWSNFPTEPPPGWEAAKSPLSICGIPVDPTPKNAKPEPRTEADRLGEVCWKENAAVGQSWGGMSPNVQRNYCNAALAVRKAVLARQLEPSEEEVKAALLCWRETLSTVAAMKDILAAAARVRLEKAEGEQS